MYNPTMFNLSLDHQRELVGDAEQGRLVHEARVYARQHAARPTVPPPGLGMRYAWQRLFGARRGVPVTS